MSSITTQDRRVPQPRFLRLGLAFSYKDSISMKLAGPLESILAKVHQNKGL